MYWNNPSIQSAKWPEYSYPKFFCEIYFPILKYRIFSISAIIVHASSPCVYENCYVFGSKCCRPGCSKLIKLSSVIFIMDRFRCIWSFFISHRDWWWLLLPCKSILQVSYYNIYVKSMPVRFRSIHNSWTARQYDEFEWLSSHNRGKGKTMKELSSWLRSLNDVNVVYKTKFL